MTATSFQLEFSGRLWAHEDLEEWIARWTNDLVSSGIKPNEPVAVEGAADPRVVVAILALRRVGACVAILHPKAAAPEIAARLNDLGSRMLLAVNPGYAPAEAPQARLDESTPLQLRLDGPPQKVAAAFVLFTSGTEGRPKGVLLSDTGFDAHADACRDRLRVTSDARWLAALPLAHVGGLAMMLRVARLGGTLVMEAGALPHDLDQLVTRLHVTHLSLVPTQLHRWVAARKGGSAPASLRSIVVGGSACPVSLVARARAHGLPVQPSYGLTEAGSQVATARLDSPAGSVGPPLPGMKVYVQAVRPGANGTIYVASPAVMLGYLGNVVKTKKALHDGWLETQDLGHVDAMGNLWVVGRTSDLIVSGGENVDPSEVEHVLLMQPDVEEACVVAAADAEWGEAVVAVMVAKPGRALDPERIRAECRVQLAPYKVPKRFFIWPRLPRAEGGKVQRSLVRAQLAGATVPT